MATCPKCLQHKPVKDIFTKPLICEQCGSKLTFPRRQYRAVTRPGIYIVIFLILNLQVNGDLRIRAIINIALLILWVLFFVRFVRYLKTVEMEVKDET